jgi:cell division protein ZapE
MNKGILEQYRARAKAGEIEADPAQIAAAERLEGLARTLFTWRPASRGGLLSIFGRKREPQPRGLYIHGSVGRGKTMLMDLFYGSVTFEPRRRIHFHEFMAEVHDRIGAARKSVPGDPIPKVGADIAKTAGLLCFDEFHVTDIADAMILGRLFTALFEAQVVVVATSNAHPNDLYRNGLNRQLFLPFIDLLQTQVEVYELKSAKDYRLEKLAGQPLYFSPADERAKTEIDRIWERLTGHHAAEPMELEVKGRKVLVPAASMGAARFGFDDLCDKPLGSVDYLHIAHAFHTVFIENIPVLTPNRREVARRFINLIDTLYDARVGLIASAAAEPDRLYVSGDGSDLFERTASRLIEMRSQVYLEARNKRAAAIEPQFLV